MKPGADPALPKDDWSHSLPIAALPVEAAFSRRLDKLLRTIDRLHYHVEVTNEALALFVRFWLSANPPLPESARASAQAQGKERYDGFIEALTRRMEFGQRLARELSPRNSED